MSLEKRISHLTTVYRRREPPPPPPSIPAARTLREQREIFELDGLLALSGVWPPGDEPPRALTEAEAARLDELHTRYFGAPPW